MDYRSDQGSIDRDADRCLAVVSDSDGSSLLSCGSTTVSLDGTQYSGREYPVSHAQHTQASKAIDLAAQSNTWIPRTPSRPASLATANSDVREAERHLLLDAGPAPPDYTQATALRLLEHTRSAEEDSLYATSDGNVPFDLPRTHKAKGIRRLLRQRWKGLCLLNLAIYCILTTTILVVVFITSHQSTFRQPEARDLFVNFPVEHPFNVRFQPGFYHPSTQQCNFTHYPEDFYFFNWLDPNNFHFEESLQAIDYKEYHGFEDIEEISISGHIDVRPAPYGQGDPLVVIVSFASTSAWQFGISEWPARDENSESLRIHRKPSEASLHSRLKHTELKRDAVEGKACLDIWVGIFVKTQFDNFSLRTENLQVDSGYWHSEGRLQGWSFRIRDNSSISTGSGNIATSDWDGRNANISSDSGSIRGFYSLNDNLHLESNHGDIAVEIWHEPALEKNYLDSHPPGSPANLSTVTGPGRQSMEIYQSFDPTKPPEFFEQKYPFLLNSTHRADSGSIAVQSAWFWEGQIHAKSITGPIDLKGTGLRTLPEPVDQITYGDESKHVWAQKGTHGSTMTMETRDGDISLCVMDSFFSCEGFLPESVIDYV